MTLCLGQVPVIPLGNCSGSTTLTPSLVFTGVYWFFDVLCSRSMLCDSVLTLNASFVITSMCKIKTGPNGGQTLVQDGIPTTDSLTTWTFPEVAQIFAGVF